MCFGINRVHLKKMAFAKIVMMILICSMVMLVAAGAEDAPSTVCMVECMENCTLAGLPLQTCQDQCTLQCSKVHLNKIDSHLGVFD